MPIAVIGVLVATGNGQHPKAQHPGESVGDQRRVALVPEAAGQKICQAEAAFRLAHHQHAAGADGRMRGPMPCRLVSVCDNAPVGGDVPTQ